MGTKSGTFHKKLLLVLDESIRNIFGETASKAVYYRLRKEYLLSLEDIPEKPQTFAKAIKEIFGETGAELIETLLVKDLRTKFEIEGKGKEIDKLADCMDQLKIVCIKK